MEFIKEKIIDIKNILKDELIIAAHHYQNKDIVDLADIVGDSYLLAKKTSTTMKKNIILCGVKFMAETVKILSQDFQNVFIPNMNAMCPLAERVSLKNLNDVFNILKFEQNLDVVPVTYVNSYADIKAFTGKNDGSCCTSSNAEKIVRYYLSKNKKIVFLPDFYLGSNTAIKIGDVKTKNIFIRDEIVLNSNENYKDVDIFLYNSFCPVHQVYQESDIIRLRNQFPEIKIVAHPESKVEVVKLADYSGSTEFIYNLINNSAEGSIWAVGTESTFVNRLQMENPGKKIFSIKESYCANMQKINLENLYQLLLYIKDNKAEKFAIDLNEEDKKWGKISLQNMINIVEDKI